MARALINIVRHLPELRLSTRFAAIELAHMADKSGVVHVAYSYLAARIGGCRRTAMRKVAALVEAGIIHKTRTRLTSHHFDWNRYTFRIPFTINAPHPFSGDTPGIRPTRTMDKMSPTPIPPPQKEKKKRSATLEWMQTQEQARLHGTPETDADPWGTLDAATLRGYLSLLSPGMKLWDIVTRALAALGVPEPVV